MWTVDDTVACDRRSFEGKSDEVKAYIDEVVAKAEAMGMVGDGRFDFEVVHYVNDDYDLNVKYEFTRTETEKETARREAAEAKEKARKAAERKKASEKRKPKNEAEYEEFLRLKAKFEGAHYGMWAIEAKRFGHNPDFFYISGLTQGESRKLHAQMSNSGEWACVREILRDVVNGKVTWERITNQ